jgi:hypothetical protein
LQAANETVGVSTQFVDAMTQRLDSVKDFIKPAVISNTPATEGNTDIADGNRLSEAGSESDVEIISVEPPSRTLMGALEEVVPTVQVGEKGHARLTNCKIIFPTCDPVCIYMPFVYVHCHGTHISQTSQMVDDFESMRTISQQVQNSENGLHYVSRKDFFSLHPASRNRLIERPLVIAADVREEESR